MVNDLGVDPDEWFTPKPHPHDSMPIAKDGPLPIRQSFGGCYNYEKLKAERLVNNDLSINRYAPPEKMKELESINPRPEEEVADWFTEQPDESDEIEKEKTVHHKMYEIATSRYNPFSVGGSENCDSDLSCNIGGSENASEK